MEKKKRYRILIHRLGIASLFLTVAFVIAAVIAITFSSFEATFIKDFEKLSVNEIGFSEAIGSFAEKSSLFSGERAFSRLNGPIP